MGNISLACVSCIERDQEEKAIQNSDLQEFEDRKKVDRSNDEAKVCEQPMAPSPSDILKQSTAPKSIDNELQARINTIINARCKPSPVHASPDGELQAHMNAILNARKQSQSQAACCSGVEQQAPIDDMAYSYEEPSMIMYSHEAAWQQDPWHQQQSTMAQSPVAQSPMELQDQINAIVGVHAKSLNHQRLSLDLASPSPSPAKSVSDMELGYFANLALSRAKERNTPVTAPPSLQPLLWSSYEQDGAIYEQDVAPCKLSFADCGTTREVQPPVPFTSLAQSDSAAHCIMQPKQKCVDITEDQTCSFDVSKIPSPTRNRSKKMMQSLWADVEVEAGSEEAPQKVVEDEPEQTEEEAAAKLKKMQAKLLLDFEEKQEMAAMDKVCVDTFLESVKKCAWRKRVATPIKGSNLYTKHIRPCRPAGTSVDVKDSTFRNLGSFLQFLESQYLIRLQPGASDPVVTEINFDACRKYKYDAQQQAQFLAAIQAPHEAGCSCRLCVPCANRGWC